MFGMDAQSEVVFELNGLYFEYDKEKNKRNIEKHGISFENAARVFFDYDRIEYYDEENSTEEDRYDIIGDTSAGNLVSMKSSVIGSVDQMIGKVNDILFVVYTERLRIVDNGKSIERIRLISARMATNFERGLYYGKYE